MLKLTRVKLIRRPFCGLFNKRPLVATPVYMALVSLNMAAFGLKFLNGWLLINLPKGTIYKNNPWQNVRRLTIFIFRNIQ